MNSAMIFSMDSKPKDKKKAFIPLLKSVNLDTLLTVKYKRTVDNGACFSLNNVSFKIEKIDILPRTRIDVLISKKYAFCIALEQI